MFYESYRLKLSFGACSQLVCVTLTKSGMKSLGFRVEILILDDGVSKSQISQHCCNKQGYLFVDNKESAD